MNFLGIPDLLWGIIATIVVGILGFVGGLFASKGAAKAQSAEAKAEIAGLRAKVEELTTLLHLSGLTEDPMPMNELVACLTEANEASTKVTNRIQRALNVIQTMGGGGTRKGRPR